jgi:hypothetical protein
MARGRGRRGEVAHTRTVPRDLGSIVGSCWHHHARGGCPSCSGKAALLNCINGVPSATRFAAPGRRVSVSIVVPVGRLWLARHWRSFVSASITIAVCFGLAFFAIAGARRTQSAYPRFLENVHSSTVSVSSLGEYAEAANSEIAAIPEVRESHTWIGFSYSVLVNGRPDFSQEFESDGTFDGEFFDQDRFTPTEGRMADPNRLDEVMVNEFAADRFGYYVGQKFDLGVYSIAQITDPNFFSDPPPPGEIVSVTLVGIGVFPDEVLQDDADRLSRFLITPALSRQWTSYQAYGLQGLVLRRGDDDVDAFLDHLAAIVPIGDVETRLTSVDRANALTAVNPLSTVIGIFGAIAAIVGIVLSGQALGRSIRSTREDMRLCVAFGASKRQVAALSLATAAVAAVCGVFVAGIAAIAASPLMPIGPVRRVEADRGVDIDVTVLAIGGLAAITILIASGAWVAWRELQPNGGRTTSTAVATTWKAARTVSAHLQPPAATGVRFALGGGRRIAARSAIASAVVAFVAVAAAVTFATSLSRLVREPALFGWNFDAAVVSGSGYDNLDEDVVRDILGRDSAVETWSGVYFGADAVGNVDVPLLGMQPNSAVRPPLVAGRFIEADDEIVVGRATAKALGVAVGDDIVLAGDGSPHTLHVVGEAVLPTIGKAHAQHTSLGRGAIVVPRLVPGSDLDILGGTSGKPLGPNALFVRFAPGVSATAELAHLVETTAPLMGFAGLDVVPVQRPAEIVTSDEVGAAPLLLAAALAIGATVSLVIALASSVRIHRRELAVLTALGFTRKQRAATLIWHSTVAVGLGLLVGIPVGAIAGRELWHVFARRIYVLAPAVIPWAASALIAVASLLLAVALGLGPARTARRLNVAAALRDP